MAAATASAAALKVAAERGAARAEMRAVVGQARLELGGDARHLRHRPLLERLLASLISTLTGLSGQRPAK